jgi:hypothetical protein
MCRHYQITITPAVLITTGYQPLLYLPAAISGESYMLKRLILLCLLLAGFPGASPMAEEADPADTSGESGQQPADAESRKFEDKGKEPGMEDEEEPECE